MNTTQKYLTAMKASNGGASDYRAAIILGISHQTVSSYKRGISQMNSETTTKMANVLGLDPAKMYAEVQLESAKSSEARHIWGRILDLTKSAPALALLAFAVMLPMADKMLSFA